MKIPKLPKITVEGQMKIITLVCYLLKNVGDLSESQLLEILIDDETVSQFDLADALGTIEDKHIATLDEKHKTYHLTDLGKAWVSEFENTLTMLVKKTMLTKGKEISHLSELRKTAKWGINEGKNGFEFYVCFVNEIDDSPIMEMRLYSKTKQGAIDIENKFLKNPLEILNNTISNFF